MSIATGRPVGRAVTFVRSLVTVYRTRDIPFMAGSIAYSAFVSLIPLVVLMVVAAAALGGESFAQTVVAATARYLTPSGQALLEQSLRQASGSVGLSVIGIVALLWAVLKVFRFLDTAFSTLYGVETAVGIAEQVRDGVVVFGAMTGALVGMVAVGTVVAFAPSLPFGFDTSPPVVRAVGFAALVAGLVVAFLPMYYVFPNVEMSLRRALPGAVVAAVGWALLQALFQVYVSVSSAGELYGVVGGVILFVTWLYFGAVVVLLGGATNVVLDGRYRPSDYDGGV